MRLVACLRTDFDMEIQHSQLKINHPSDTSSTKADKAVSSTKAVGGRISVVCLTRTSRYRSKRRSWLVPLLPTFILSWLLTRHYKIICEDFVDAKRGCNFVNWESTSQNNHTLNILAKHLLA